MYARRFQCWHLPWEMKFPKIECGIFTTVPELKTTGIPPSTKQQIEHIKNPFFPTNFHQVRHSPGFLIERKPDGQMTAANMWSVSWQNNRLGEQLIARLTSTEILWNASKFLWMKGFSNVFLTARFSKVEQRKSHLKCWAPPPRDESQISWSLMHMTTMHRQLHSYFGSATDVQIAQISSSSKYIQTKW